MGGLGWVYYGLFLAAYCWVNRVSLLFMLPNIGLYKLANNPVSAIDMSSVGSDRLYNVISIINDTLLYR